MNRLGARRLFYRNPFTILGKRDHCEDLSGSGLFGRTGARGWPHRGRLRVPSGGHHGRSRGLSRGRFGLRAAPVLRVGAVTVPEGGEVVLTVPPGRVGVAVEGRGNWSWTFEDFAIALEGRRNGPGAEAACRSRASKATDFRERYTQGLFSPASLAWAEGELRSAELLEGLFCGVPPSTERPFGPRDWARAAPRP